MAWHGRFIQHNKTQRSIPIQANNKCGAFKSERSRMESVLSHMYNGFTASIFLKPTIPPSLFVVTLVQPPSFCRRTVEQATWKWQRIQMLIYHCQCYRTLCNYRASSSISIAIAMYGIYLRFECWVFQNKSAQPSFVRRLLLYSNGSVCCVYV